MTTSPKNMRVESEARWMSPWRWRRVRCFGSERTKAASLNVERVPSVSEGRDVLGPALLPRDVDVDVNVCLKDA